MSAVIDKNSFDNIKGYIEWAKADKDCEIITGGTCMSHILALLIF